jgi:hypothetical protein
MITTELIEALERNARDALVIVNDSALEAIGSNVMIDGHINLREIAMDLVPLLYVEAKKHWSGLGA